MTNRLTVTSAVPLPAWLVLVGTGLLTFQGGLLRVALPVIRSDLDTGVSGIQLVSLAGLVVVTTTLVSFGRLADLVGPDRIYVVGLVGFTVGGLLAAAAPTTGLLVLALGAQGLGWSMCIGAGPPLLVTTVPHRMRGQALAGYHVAVAVGLGAGPAVGGLLIDFIGWRAALAATVLVALPVTASLHRQTDSQQPGKILSPRSFDIPGAVLLGLALAGLLLLLRNGTRLPLSDGLLAGLVAAALAIFVVQELHSDHPVLNLRLFSRRAFSAGLVASFLNFIAMAANMFLMPFLLQDHRGHSPTAAGAIMASVPLAILAVAPLAGRTADRIGSRLPATLGLGLVTVGVGLMAALDRHTPLIGVVVVLSVYGAGAAFFQSPNISGVLAAAGHDRVGVASGTLSTLSNLGQIVGIALAGSIWDSALSHPAIPPGSATPYRVTFLVLAAFGALAAAASWLRGPPPPSTVPSTVALPAAHTATSPPN